MFGRTEPVSVPVVILLAFRFVSADPLPMKPPEALVIFHKKFPAPQNTASLFSRFRVIGQRPLC